MNSKPGDYALSISLFQHQGAREAQEDAYCVAPIYPGHLLAVFDGHCGAQVAQAAALRLPGLFADHLDRVGVRHAGVALRLALGELMTLCADGCPQPGHLPPAGATATAAFVMPSSDGRGHDVFAGVLGDSPLFALSRTSRKAGSSVPNTRLQPRLGMSHGSGKHTQRRFRPGACTSRRTIWRRITRIWRPHGHWATPNFVSS